MPINISTVICYRCSFEKVNASTIHKYFLIAWCFFPNLNTYHCTSVIIGREYTNQKEVIDTNRVLLPEAVFYKTL